MQVQTPQIRVVNLFNFPDLGYKSELHLFVFFLLAFAGKSSFKPSFREHRLEKYLRSLSIDHPSR